MDAVLSWAGVGLNCGIGCFSAPRAAYNCLLVIFFFLFEARYGTALFDNSSFHSLAPSHSETLLTHIVHHSFNADIPQNFSHSHSPTDTLTLPACRTTSCCRAS